MMTDWTVCYRKRNSKTCQAVEQFTDLISQYDKVMELDRELLNRLIDKIVVGDRIKVDDGYYQKVSIHYKFIGELE